MHQFIYNMALTYFKKLNQTGSVSLTEHYNLQVFSFNCTFNIS